MCNLPALAPNARGQHQLRMHFTLDPIFVMIRLSNHGTLNLKSTQYFVCFALVVVLIFFNFQIIGSGFEGLALYSLIPIDLFLVVVTVFSFIRTRRLNQAFIDEKYLYIKSYSKSDKIELSKIEDVKYMFWPINPFFEFPFVIKFNEATKFGKRIYVYPTNLDENKRIKANLNRKGLLEEIVNKNRV